MLGVNVGMGNVNVSVEKLRILRMLGMLGSFDRCNVLLN